MPYSFKLSRRIARFRAPFVAGVILTFAACNASDSLNPDVSSAPAAPSDPGTETGVTATTDQPLAAASFAGGIPIGVFHLSSGSFGGMYNGAMHTVSPSSLLNDLATAKAHGGKLAIDLSGNEKYYKDSRGNFSLSMWKARVARFKNINFQSYINDGTIIAHYIIDEPNDASNWNGHPVPASTVEAMAAYSKQLWPGMATVARVDATYLAYNHKYLDAAWAQYVYRKGTASNYITTNVNAAKARGLALITGMNILSGGPSGSRMTATQVKDWGSTILANSYPCAFITWKWSDYYNTSGMKTAMSTLRSKAQNRPLKNCKS